MPRFEMTKNWPDGRKLSVKGPADYTTDLVEAFWSLHDLMAQ